MKQFAALARVSSREQEREGFSLEVQEEALKRYAIQAGGEIVKFFKIAETASKRDERRSFKDLISYAKKNAFALDGLLFYKVDRASRNLFDYVELERLESEYDLPFISVSQPTENTPAGRMMRRTLANMASFYTEQQSVDVKEGLERRVKEGWFANRAPYGYRNVRVHGRGVVEVDSQRAENVRRMFSLYAYENCTLDMVVERLNQEHRVWTPSTPKFSRSSVHTILRDRSYLGEVQFRGNWYQGKQEPLVDRSTWERVQSLLGGHLYQAHTLTYAGQLIQCSHCGHPITGEIVTKRSKTSEKQYTYYRCTKYTGKGHPRTRLREMDLETQVLGLFEKMKIHDPKVCDWFRAVLRSQTQDDHANAQAQRRELNRQYTLLTQQQGKLVDLRLADEIDPDLFAQKQTEIRDRLASIKLQLDVLERSSDETTELAIKVFELSQVLTEKWLAADYSTKRRILEIIGLNWSLVGVTLVPQIRKPFDVLTEGLVSRISGEGGI